VTAELQRERVDIIMWDPNPREFIRNALSPAKVGSIELDTDAGEARVMVGNDQLSLAIGKGGQNVRLAAKLTGFRIDLVASEAISDLDAAMAAAASRQADVGGFAPGDTRRAAFDALFSASPEGKAAGGAEAGSAEGGGAEAGGAEAGGAEGEGVARHDDDVAVDDDADARGGLEGDEALEDEALASEALASEALAREALAREEA
jgi:hypothetical protein